MNAMDTINIACATSREYLYPTSIMLSSLKSSISESRAVNVFVFCAGENQSMFNRHFQALRTGRFSVDLVAIDTYYSVFNEWFSAIDKTDGRTSFNALAGSKLLMHKLLPGEFDRALWLDSDLVIRADIGELWRTGIFGSAVGAIQDENIPRVRDRWGSQTIALGFDDAARYYNSGVLLVDLHEYSRFISEEAINELLVKFASRKLYEVFRYYDQDILNCLLTGRIQPIDHKWNRTKRRLIGWRDFRQHRDEADNGPSVQHYPHLDKPWLWKTSTAESVYFYTAAQQAPWPGDYTRRRWLLVVLFALIRRPVRRVYRTVMQLGDKVKGVGDK